MKILSSLLAASAALLLFSACESTPLEERFVPVDSDSFEPQRTVLIEEYTGQTCVNCPGAHELMERLEERFNSPEHLGVLSVGIHIPVFGRHAPAGLVATEADTYSNGVDNAPTARINRRTGVVNTDQWTGAILNELLRKSPIVFSELTADAAADGSAIRVDGKIRSTENISDAKLQLWLVEDDIVMPQMKPDGPVADYVHRAVFRGALNGVNGQSIDIKEKKEVSFSLPSFPLFDYVNLENLRVVAFVYTEADGVLNAYHCKVNKLTGGIQIVNPQD